MSGATSNADQVSALLAQLTATFDLTRPGQQTGSLGADLLALTAVGIRDHAISDQAAPDGSAWAENRGQYGAHKQERGLPIGVGLEADSPDRMLSHLQVMGVQTIEPDRATMTYGVSEAARRKAQWFTRGSDGPGEGEPSGAKNQPPRVFYDFNDTLRAELTDYLAEHLERVIADLKS